MSLKCQDDEVVLAKRKYGVAKKSRNQKVMASHFVKCFTIYKVLSQKLSFRVW